MFRFLALALSALYLGSASAAQEPARLVDDLTPSYPTQPTLFAYSLTSLGDRAYFWGGPGTPGGQGTDSAGFELWTTDGTLTGTRFVFDALPGKRSSWDYGVTAPVALGNEVFFGTCDDLLRCHLWKSDGVEGAEAVAELEPDAGRLNPQVLEGFRLVAGVDRLYFAFPDRRYGPSLWTSDGTAEGTRLLVGSLSDSQSLEAVFPQSLQTGDRLTASLGDALWTSDGTPEGTFKVAGVRASRLVASGALAFLKVPDGKKHRLWVSDGTADGTHPLLEKSLEVDELVPVGDGRCFVLGPSQGHSLWITDGTADGTRYVTGRSPSTAAVMFGGKLYFAGDELMRVDPGDLVVERVFDDPRIDRLIASGDSLYLLTYYDGARDTIRRWSVGERPPGTIRSRGFSVADSVGAGGALAIGGALTLLETGSFETREVPPPPSGASTWPRNLTATGDGGSLVFATLAGDGRDGRVYRVRDGVAELLREEAPPPWPSYYPAASFARTADRTMVFYPALQALDEESGILTPVAPEGSPPLQPLRDSVVELDGRLYFPDRGDPKNAGIWQLDGAQLTKVSGIDWSFMTDPEYDGPPNLACQTGVSAGENLFFYYLGDFWSVRGDEARKLPGFGPCLEAAPHGDDLFFASATRQDPADTVRVQRLSRSDGTSGGTVVLYEDALPYPDRIRDPLDRFLPEWRWSEPIWVGDRLFFVAGDEEHGRELWTSDGTAAGTALFADLRPGRRSSSPRGLVEMDGRLYFAADDGTAGHELWTTDGTPGGTVLVADIAPGPDSSYPQSLTAIDGRLLMAAMGDPEQGLELWKSDGTAEGTYLLQEIEPGPVSSDPGRFTAAGEKVYFEAATVAGGYELYSMPRDVLQEDPPPPPPPPPPTPPPPPLPPAEGPAGLVGDLTTVADTPPWDPYSPWNDPSPRMLVSKLTALGDRLYFWGNVEGELVVDPAGYELWTSDGTVAGTRLLFDVLPGRRSSWDTGVTVPVAMGGSVYFGACDDLPRCALWKSDGIESAEPVAVLEPDVPGYAGIGHLIAGEDRLYFTLREEPIVHSLWTSDGTSAGTRRLWKGTVYASPPFVFPDTLQAGDRLTAVLGDNLLTSDGTPEGTVELADLERQPTQLVSSGGLAFMKTGDRRGIPRLWVSDGTPGGTRPLLQDSLEVETLVAAPDGRCFVLSPSLGHSLWITDGTAGGTSLVTTERSSSTTAVVAGGKLYFAGRGGETLARVDADGNGYTELFEGEPISRLVLSGNVLYVFSYSAEQTTVRRFSVDEPFAGLETLGGGDLWTGFGEQAGVGGGLAQSYPPILLEAGSIEPQALQPSSPASTWPRYLTATGRGDDLLFAPRAHPTFAIDERVYLVRDGVAELLRKDPFPPTADIVLAGDRPFVLSPGVQELDEESATLRPLDPSALSPYPGSGVEFRGQLYFANRGVFGEDPGREGIWKVDGTEATRVFPVGWSHRYDLDWRRDPDSCAAAVAAGKNIFFWIGGELWSSPGGPAARKLTDDIFDLCLDGTSYRDEVSFVGTNREESGTYVTRLYRSDGTDRGTFALKELGRSYGEWTAPQETAWMGGRVFFVADDDEHGRELWTSDGTVEGTALFADIRPGVRSSFPRGLVEMDGHLYFAADDGVSGHELWTSDGTPQGTVLLRDIATGEDSSYPQSLTVIDGRLLFAAMGSREQGLELWISDGTALGTYPLQEIQPGPFSSDPSGFVAAGDTIYFEAATREEGFELWSMSRSVLQEEPTSPPTPPPPEPSCPDATACLVDGRFEVTVEWRNPRDGTSGAGRPISFSDESSLFWFFSDGNVELIVKILDGRRINGHYWVFYGGLSDVEYWITVTDAESGAVRKYHNPPGRICGESDTLAFD